MTATTPLVSVVTPSYQQGRFIERTLESVRRQGAGKLAGRIEHFVMDGGSTDGTVDILERWKERLSYTSGPDGGQTAAINAGLAKCRGEFLAYLNSDDVYYDGAVEAALAAFESDPTADVVYGEADHIDVDDKVIERYPTEEWSLGRMKVTCFICQPTVFLRRRVLEKFGPFDASLRYCMDYEYWLRLAVGGARFVHVPAKLAGSRLHAETKTLGSREKVHAELNSMLRTRLGSVPDNWLSNWAHAVLDGRGIPRSTSLWWTTRVSLLTVWAAFRWNGYPSPALLRMVGWWMKASWRGWRESRGSGGRTS